MRKFWRSFLFVYIDFGLMLVKFALIFICDGIFDVDVSSVVSPFEVVFQCGGIDECIILKAGLVKEY